MPVVQANLTQSSRWGWPRLMFYSTGPLLAAVLSVLAGLLLVPPASAVAQQPPRVEPLPASAAPGETITLQGSNWPSGIALVARLYEATNIGGPGADLAMAFEADSNGSFSVQGTVPHTLFGQGGRGNLTVVPGDYVIVVRGGAHLAPATPFRVGAPAQKALLWGEVVFDSNGNWSRDSSDSVTGGLIGVSLAFNRVEGPVQQAVTDARGRYQFSSLTPGTYYLAAETEYQSERWVGTATVSAGEGEAVRLDLLLRRSSAPSDPPPVNADRCFGETGFCVERHAFWNYFGHRGGIRTLGYPVSRTFQFLGRPTQFFQRLVLQEGPDGSVSSLNLLDPGLLPYTNVNGSQFPAVMDDVKTASPVVGTPGYDTRIVDFVRQVAPDQLPSGERVGFFNAFMGTVTCQDAYPQGGCPEQLLPLLNLEIWGAPTSRPVPDPTNAGFVYMRFQRGILHYQGQDAGGNPIAEGILLADWFKSLVTGQNLPADLEDQARADSSRFLRQYCPDQPAWICRPAELPSTDLTSAFERQH